MNRLAGETSPYLLQHADNPVDWYPWGDEAFAARATEDRPILLSIGYSACHWCHVMEHESFEDEETARADERALREREGRPRGAARPRRRLHGRRRRADGQGGWPMTVFLTPAGEPFLGGTYFPPDPRHGLPSFRQVLNAVSDVYRERRDDVADQARALTAAIARSAELEPSREPLTDAVFSSAARALRETSTRCTAAGAGRRSSRPRRRSSSCSAGTTTTRAGWSRRLSTRWPREACTTSSAAASTATRSTREWLVPHFEKMLYDNALLAATYLHGWVADREPSATAAWRSRRSTTCCASSSSRDGGLASAQDADTDGVEGITFTWTAEEGVAPELLRPFEHGRSVIRGELDEETRARLHALRELRPKPLRDDKAIASWNGLALAALAEAARRLERPDLLDAAVAVGEFLLGPLSDADGSSAATARGRRAAPATSTTTRTPRTGCSSSTSRPASSAGSSRRTGSRGSRSSSSATASAAASSSRPATASGSWRRTRISTTTRSPPGTRCSLTCCSGSRGSTATTSWSAPRSASCGSSCRCSSVLPPRSAGRSVRSTSTSRRPASSRSPAPPDAAVARAALAPFQPRTVVAFGPRRRRAAARGQDVRGRTARGLPL